MFVIDVMSRVPVYEQIINQVEEQIMTGILKEGDKMPSVRSLSVKLSTNPNSESVFRAGQKTDDSYSSG